MSVTFWPGKQLSAEEEAWLRQRVASLQRAETTLDDQAARKERLSLERYLPENVDAWTPDQLEAGAHAGPWITLEGSVA